MGDFTPLDFLIIAFGVIILGWNLIQGQVPYLSKNPKVRQRLNFVVLGVNILAMVMIVVGLVMGWL